MQDDSARAHETRSVEDFAAVPGPNASSRTPEYLGPIPAALARGFYFLGTPQSARGVTGLPLRDGAKHRMITSGLSIPKNLFFSLVATDVAHESNLEGGRISMLAIAKTEHQAYGLARNRIARFTAHGGWLQSLPDDHSEAQALLAAVVAHFNGGAK